MANRRMYSLKNDWLNDRILIKTINQGFYDILFNNTRYKSQIICHLYDQRTSIGSPNKAKMLNLSLFFNFE